MSVHKILIVEDEKQIARFLQLELLHEGYEVEVLYDGRQVVEKVAEDGYDLILLDVMLPGLNGYDICRRIRKISTVPIIMVTAKDDIEDEVLGLELGANDYITKPYSIEILLARMRRLLKDCHRVEVDDGMNTSEEKLQVKDLTMNTMTYEVTLKDEVLKLTKKEYDLLHYLLINMNVVVTREQILQAIWGYDYVGDSNTVDVYIRYLRSKIDDQAKQKYIHTIRGVGYVIRE